MPHLLVLLLQKRRAVVIRVANIVVIDIYSLRKLTLAKLSLEYLDRDSVR